MINTLTKAKSFLAWLKSLGSHIVIDEVTHSVDAATYIHQLPIDCLKLSQTAIAPPQISEAYLSEWVNVSQKKNIQLVAKGVETYAALEQVKALGLQYAQGYQLSKPSPLVSSQPHE